ncbi:MAG TPA: hypothetical protein VEA18_00300 [Candidatus Kapabacteria bacterium]|nr:hypothetical protein [Candidatus Kapabacteria bacterium]
MQILTVHLGGQCGQSSVEEDAMNEPAKTGRWSTQTNKRISIAILGFVGALFLGCMLMPLILPTSTEAAPPAVPSITSAP